MIFDFLRGAKGMFCLGILFACLSTLADMVRPKIIEFTVDGILGDTPFALPGFLNRMVDALGGMDSLRAKLFLPAIGVVLCSAAAAVLRYFYQTFTVKGSETFVKSMRDKLFAHIERLSCQWHSAHQTGDIIQRCTTDVEEVKTFLSDQLVTLLSMIITITLSLAFLFRISLKLGFVSLASMPILIGYSFWFHQKIGASFLDCDEEEGVLSTIAQENLTGVRVVRAFGREASEQERFARQNQTVTDKWVHLGKYLCSFWFCGDFLTGATMLVLLSWGCALCVGGTLTVGGLLAAISYLTMQVRPVRGMGRVLSEMSKTGVSMQRLLEIMAAPVEQDVPGADEPPMDGDIVFDHVSFAYPNSPELLHDVSFTIPAGTTLGILGGTGSGKSTLMYLLQRLYEPTSGTISIGGVPLNKIDREYLRSHVGLILQEPFLYSKSIRDNVGIALNHPDMERIVDAAQIACAEGFITKADQSWDTLVGERGVTLSGGQKQRVAIARTLLKDNHVLIFDDSLSAVDTETDAQIRSALHDRAKDTTTLIISHRITTLSQADFILVLEDGRVADQGTHAELCSRPGLYQRINNIQNVLEDELNQTTLQTKSEVKN